MNLPDRLSIALNHALDLRGETPDLINHFFKSSSSLSRKDNFLYAMALGLKAPSKIDGKKEAIFNTRDLNSMEKALIYSCIIEKDTDLEELADAEKIFERAQECANTGFGLIKDIMKSNTENLEKKLLRDLDLEFEKIKNELQNY